MQRPNLPSLTGTVGQRTNVFSNPTFVGGISFSHNRRFRSQITMSLGKAMSAGADPRVCDQLAGHRRHKNESLMLLTLTQKPSDK